MAIYQIDTIHSAAEFTVKHMMITTVRGIFEDITGTVEFDADNPENSSVTASIKTASISTRVEDRDNHLRSADFFDAEKHPEMTFVSTSIKTTGDNKAEVTGDLTIRGTTKPVTFDVEYFGEIDSPFGDKRVGFEGNVTINREDWGLTWNQALEAGGVVVSKDVKITVQLQAVKQAVTA